MVSFLKPTDVGVAKPVMKMEIRYKAEIDLKEQGRLDMVKRIIEENFNSAGIIRREGDMYVGNGDAGDYVAFGKVAISLMKDVSLLKYIDEWLYYDEYGNICDCGTLSKKDAGLLPQDAPDKTMYNEETFSVMKMEIRYNEPANSKDQRSLDNLVRVVDELFKSYGLSKKEGEHIYIGNNDEHDYARFVMVFNELNGWKTFLKHVDVWNFYNEHGETEDFVMLSRRKAVAL